MPGWKKTIIPTGGAVQVSSGPITLHSITLTKTLAVGVLGIYDSVGAVTKLCDLKTQSITGANEVKPGTYILNWQFETALYISNTLVAGCVVSWG